MKSVLINNQTMSEPQHISAIAGDFQSRFDALLSDDAFWLAKDAEIAAADEQARRAAELEKIETQRRRAEGVPEIYRQPFDRTRSKYMDEVVSKIARWSYKSSEGIGLIGTTGLGKTRVLTAKLLSLKCSWLYLPASKLGKCVSAQYAADFRVAGDALATMADARKVRVLLLDDIGDENPTESVGTEFKDLIEHRTSRGLPTLWTCNLTHAQLALRHKTRGEALVRRLTEFSWVP